MSDYGIKVSAPGFNATDNTTYSAPGDGSGTVSYPAPYGLYFSSGWFLYKVVATGTLSGSVGATGVGGGISTLTLNHSLGYPPMVDLFFSIDGGVSWWANNSETQLSSTGTPLQSASIQSTSTNITVEIFGVSMGAYNITCKYLIYAEPGS